MTDHIFFANDNEKPDFLFSNEFSLESDGWGQLFKFGDFPGKAVIANGNGTVTSFDAIQRLDRDCADQMTANFYSIGNKIKRFIKGISIFNGHPDMPDAGNKYPDKAEKGLVVELQVRDNGLYCKPAFNNAGQELLNGSKKLFFSGRWSSDELAEEDGKRVFRPDSLKSVGMTPRPNLPVEQLNEKEQMETPPPKMKKIIVRLIALGITVANDATEDQVDAAVGQLADKQTTLAGEKTTLANEKATLTAQVTAKDTIITNLTTERDSFKTSFGNERKARITGLLDGAVTDGRITAAERVTWETRLAVETSFANEADAIVKLKPATKTQSLIIDVGSRKTTIANAQDRQEAVRDLVALEIANTKCDYNAAFTKVQKANPALFDAMKQPAKN